MKFSVLVEDLRGSVSLIKDVVSQRAVSQEQSGVLLEVSDDKVVFSVVGSHMVMRVSCPAVVEENGRACVNSFMFSNIVSTFSPISEDSGTDSIDFVLDSHNGFLLLNARTIYKGKAVSNKRKVPRLNSELFPSIPRYNADGSFIFPAEKLKSALDSTFFAANKGSSDVFSGVNLKSNKGKLVAVASDSIKLCEYMDIVEDAPDFDVIIPARVAHKISKSISEDSFIRVSITNSMFWVSATNTLIGGILINDKYPDYRSYLEQPHLKAVVEKTLIEDNIRNLDIGLNEDNRVVLKFKDDTLMVSTDNAENSSIKCDFSGELEVSFDIKHLRPVIGSFRGDLLLLEFCGPVSPVYLSDPDQTEDGGKLVAILVPLKPKMV